LANDPLESENNMLSRSGLHAIRAMMVLAQSPGSYQGTQSISAATGSPRNYLGKILQQLSRYGLVESQKGLGGGFRLSRDAREISLYDIVDGLEDMSRWSDCILGNERCSEENPCPIHRMWVPVRDSYLNMLKNTSVADLTLSGLPGEWPGGSAN